MNSMIRGKDAPALLRWRWWVLAVGAAVPVLVERIADYQTEETHLLVAFLIGGVVFPLGVWLLMTAAARGVPFSQSGRLDLERQRQLFSKLTQPWELSDLSRFITTFPATFLPVVRTSLHLYDHRA